MYLRSKLLQLANYSLAKKKQPPTTNTYFQNSACKTLTLRFFCLLFLASSAAIPAASLRYLLPTLLSNHFRSTKTSLKCSRSNCAERVMFRNTEKTNNADC